MAEYPLTPKQASELHRLVVRMQDTASRANRIDSAHLRRALAIARADHPLYMLFSRIAMIKDRNGMLPEDSGEIDELFAFITDRIPAVTNHGKARSLVLKAAARRGLL